MAATHDFVLQTAAGNIKDVTDVSVNPLATETTTPRQGGFTIRNRVNFDAVNSSADLTMPASALYSTSKVKANQIYVLDVPKRTTVKTIHVYAVAGETAPNHAYTHASSAASAASSDVIAHTLAFSAKAYKDEDQTTFATVVNGQLGEFDIAAMATSTSVISTSTLNSGIPAAVSASSTTTPTNCVARATVAGVNGAAGASTYDNNTYFPFGGKVLINLKGSNAWEASSNKAGDYSGRVGGVWEIQADCNYIPE
jgi:hypothetical protein